MIYIDPTGMSLDNYGVDKDGNISLLEKTDDKYDVLYAVDNSGNKTDTNGDGSVNESDGAKVNDKSLLPELSKTKTSKDGYGVSFASTNSKSDAFNVFHFVTTQTNVEWGLDGFQYPQSQKAYVLSTYHVDYTSPGEGSIGFNAEYQLFDIHSHAKTNNKFGGSSGDMTFIKNKSLELAKKGIKLPNHYVYEKENSSLYHYNTQKSSIFIRKIKNANDYNFGNF